MGTDPVSERHLRRPGTTHAEVAETEVTIFTSRRKKEHLTCRLVVRRVKRLNPAVGTGQGELFTTHRHHTFVTNSALTMIEADARHRDHAIVEQVPRRTRERSPRPPTVRKVRRQHGLARARSDHLQPRQ
nr:hypothetical protein [Rhodococcus ruber]